MLLRTLLSRIKRFLRSLRIKNKEITIVSNNCWGGFMYQSYNLKYNSPFIGLFMFAPDYIKLLDKFNDYISLNSRMEFIDKVESKFVRNIKSDYPIGLLKIEDSTNQEDIEIHFLHYSTKEEAAEKWFKRIKRVNKNNMIVKFCDRDLCTPELIHKFDLLPFKNKVCFTSTKYENLDSVCYLPPCKGLPYVEDEWKISPKYWDFVKTANKIGKCN